jgi:hypothetical protein
MKDEEMSKVMKILCKVLEEEEKAKNLNRTRAANILMNCNIFQPEDEWSREMLLTVGIRGQSFKQWLEALNIDTTKENWEEVYYTKLKNLFDKNYKRFHNR